MADPATPVETPPAPAPAPKPPPPAPPAPDDDDAEHHRDLAALHRELKDVDARASARLAALEEGGRPAKKGEGSVWAWAIPLGVAILAAGVYLVRRSITTKVQP